MKYLSRNFRAMAMMAVCMSAVAEASAGGHVTQATLDADSVRVGDAQAAENTASLNLTTAQAELERDTASFNAESAAVAAHPVLGTFDKIEALAETLVDDVRTELTALVGEGRALVQEVIGNTPPALDAAEAKPLCTDPATAHDANLDPSTPAPADAVAETTTDTSQAAAVTDGSPNPDITSNGAAGAQ